MNSDLTQERLQEVLDYDPSTGVFQWRFRTGRWAKRAMAGSLVQGYISITVDGTRYYAHRLVFLWMTGAFPPADVDHRDGVRDNNRWENLRAATRGENHQNRKYRDREIVGAYWCEQRQKWHATIRLHSRNHFLGAFDRKEDARSAYLAAKPHFHSFQPTLRES